MGRAPRLRSHACAPVRNELLRGSAKPTTGAISTSSMSGRSSLPTPRFTATSARGDGVGRGSSTKCAAEATWRRSTSRARETYGTAVFSLPLITDRMVTVQPQGRDSRTYQYSNLGSWLRGNHELQFGGHLQQMRINPYSYAWTFPGSRLRVQRQRACVACSSPPHSFPAGSAPPISPPPIRGCPFSRAPSARWARRSR